MELIKSHSGRFEVMLDKRLIFSKAEEYRFPEEDEIIELLRPLLK